MSRSGVRIGLRLGHETQLWPDKLCRVAREADEAEIDSLWVSEHTVIPKVFASTYPYRPDGTPGFDGSRTWCNAFSLLAFIGGVTKRIRLGTSVVPVITRQPLMLAKEAATTDLLSSGRLELGLGTGWLLEEAEVLGLPHDRRFRRLAEAIDIARLAWDQPSFTFAGACWSIPEVSIRPQPPQGKHLPIWIGGSGPLAIRTANAHRTGLIMVANRVDSVRQVRRELHQDLSLALYTPIGDMSSQEFANKVDLLHEQGVDLVIVEPASDELDQVHSALDRIVGSGLLV